MYPHGLVKLTKISSYVKFRAKISTSNLFKKNIFVMCSLHEVHFCDYYSRWFFERFSGVNSIYYSRLVQLKTGQEGDILIYSAHFGLCGDLMSWSNCVVDVSLVVSSIFNF